MVVGLVTLQSGVPIAVTQTTNFNVRRLRAQRPNLVATRRCKPTSTTAHWFNTAAFSIAPQFTIRSARATLRGPHRPWTSGRPPVLVNGAALEFRAEIFNLLVTVNPARRPPWRARQTSGPSRPPSTRASCSSPSNTSSRIGYNRFDSA
jgi:hypothetical protein